jgi:hypothetical protein
MAKACRFATGKGSDFVALPQRKKKFYPFLTFAGYIEMLFEVMKSLSLQRLHPFVHSNVGALIHLHTL